MHAEYQELDMSQDVVNQLSEEAVQQPQLLVEILNAISDRVFLKDISGRITFVNRAFLRAYGYSASDVIGKLGSEVLPAQMMSQCEAADVKVLEQGEAICLETDWHDNESGIHHWSETHKVPLRDEQGMVTGLVGISRDITSRRKTEEELKRQKALFELIIETVPDEIFVKDRNRRILLANRAFYRGNKLDPQNTLGCDPTENLTDDLKQFSVQSDNFILQEGQPLCGEITRTDPEGKVEHLEVRKLPLRENDEIIGVVAVARDLTEAREAEQKSKQNETLLLHASRLSTVGELAAEFAHEVNQPLYSILNYAKAVENTLENPGELDLEALRKWVRQIRNEASRGGTITKRLKSFVKPADTLRETSNLAALVLVSIEFLASEARDIGLSIEVELEENLSSLSVDRIQIQQVLVNLLKNAIEALSEQPTTEPRVVVSTRALADGIEIKVADNGPGVPTNSSVDILEPFHTTKHDGLGLGLAICNTIVKAHQGQLNYYNNEWGGTTFSFTLPTAN